MGCGEGGRADTGPGGGFECPGCDTRGILTCVGSSPGCMGGCIGCSAWGRLAGGRYVGAGCCIEGCCPEGCCPEG